MAMFPGAHNFGISHSNSIVRETHYHTEDIQMEIQPPGRNEISESLEKFFLKTTFPTKQKVFLLYGLGGVGKTQTALEFKQRLSLKKSKANTEQSIQASYFVIVIDNGIVQAQDWHAGIHWLHSNEESWFIIMDNADDPKIHLAKNPDLQDVAAQSLEVQNMVPTEGIQLLSEKAVGGPLTADQEKKVAQIAKKLQNLRKQILQKEIPQSLDGYPLSIYATWKLSWDELGDQAKALLSVCAHLHYEKIPRLLFERAMKNIDIVYLPLGPSKAVYEDKIILAELATLEHIWDPNQFDEIVIEANSYSLLQISDEGLYEIHPLVQQWLQDIFYKDKIQGTQGIIASTLQNISWKDIHFNQHMAFHCFAIQQFECGGLLDILGQYHQALKLWEPWLETFVLGKEHPNTLTRIQNLAVTLREMGKLNETLSLQQPLYETSKRVLGKEHPNTLMRIQNLAEIFRHLGRFNEALALEQPLLETSKRVSGEEHPNTMTTIQNLAVTLIEMGRFKEALSLQQPLLEKSKSVLGEEHPNTLSRIQNLAELFKRMGRLNEALSLEQPLLETSRRVLGQEHPHTLTRNTQSSNHIPKHGTAAWSIESSTTFVEYV
ncbi:hypothetical protein F5877DRAFT_70648 [Lentinula edodes]|nr:hypothetical protein F5877DRAFT_70648 [Lentinula edodes]